MSDEIISKGGNVTRKNRTPGQIEKCIRYFSLVSDIYA